MARMRPVTYRKKTQNAMVAPSVLGRRRCFALSQTECKFSLLEFSYNL